MTAVTHEAKLSQLQQRVGEIDAAIAALDSQYLELAGRFDSHDKHLLQQAEQIEEKGAKLRRERAVCLAAAGQVEQQRQREQVEQEQQARRKLQIEARQHADAVCVINTRIDEALQALADLIAQRSNAVRALIDTGEGNGDWLRKQLGKPVLTRAMCNFGLHRTIDIVGVAATSHAPLSSANRVLGSIDIADEPPKRLNGDGAL
jgi:hypothetical protein